MNRLVAVEPLPPKSIKQTTLKGGLMGIAQKVELIGLKVILNSDDGKFKAGQRVFVRGDLSAQDLGANIQEINGLTFVLIPDSYVQLVVNEA